MNRRFKNLMMVGAVAALLIPASAFAQKSGGGVAGGARLRPGAWNSSTTRSNSTYRASERVVVPTERESTAVAQAPTERRSYSYEPGTKDASSQGTSNPCVSGSSAKAEKAPATKNKSTDSRRSFSYEPSMSEAPAVERTYAAPRMRASESPWKRSTGSKADRNNQRN